MIYILSQNICKFGCTKGSSQASANRPGLWKLRCDQIHSEKLRIASNFVTLQDFLRLTLKKVLAQSQTGYLPLKRIHLRQSINFTHLLFVKIIYLTS